MKTLSKQSGNAMIYVLLIVALFAALSFVLARQGRNNEQSPLSGEKVTLAANQIISASNQVKQGTDQIIFSGRRIDQLDLCLPGNTCFSTGTRANKIFDPAGGGIILPRIPAEALFQVDTNPAPGWYLGRFNNVGWTQTNASDVLLVAHQISQPVCAKINQILTGSTTIPALTGAIAPVLIRSVNEDGGAQHGAGANTDLTTTTCPTGCDGRAALCVSNNTNTMWSYYSIIQQR